MYLKHVILEGFKSYRDRTDIGTFDPHFNAITGLNGSGKSNILDAICFVLGLSSMNVVRATTLGDLIYKGGGGGVTRASASLIFDNKDKTPGKCPVGYEKHEEIIVSRTIEAAGQCKYYLNSFTSTKKQITDLFESVQLNLSTPNFMIMQGKITKVINMSAKQILAMIEETVGGNVYQGKRDKTAQEITNKDRCIDLVKTTIREDIYPEWRRQRDAREKLQEFQTIEYQTAKAQKVYAILKYKDLDQKYVISKEELSRVVELDRDDTKKIEESKETIDSNKKRQHSMKKENLHFQEKIEAAEKIMNAEKKVFMTVEARKNAAKLDIDDSNKKLVVAERAKKQQEKEMSDYKKKSASSVEEFEGVKAQIASAEEELRKAKEQEHALKMGNIVDEDGSTRDARKELMRVQDEIHMIQPDHEVAQQQFDEDKKKLAIMEHRLKKTPTNDEVERDYNAKLKKAEELKAEAASKNINPDDSTSGILKSLNNNKTRLQQLSKEKDKIFGNNYHLSFQYERKDMVDSSKIHGCMYELLKFNQMEEWGCGMEVIAGGTLSHIVVEDAVVGKALLNAGLRRRTMIHPLSVFKCSNKSTVTQQDLDRRIGPGKAVPVIDLIECDPRYKDIVQHYFGGKVLCDNIETAKKVAFTMGHYAASKLGDVADPEGVMIGGTRRNLGALMKTCEDLRVVCAEIKDLQNSVGDLQRRLQAAQTNEVFMKDLEVAKRDLHNAEETRKLTAFSILQHDIQELKEKLVAQDTTLKETKLKLTELEKEKKSWSTKVNQLDHLREKGKKDNVALVKKWEKALETAKKKYEAKEKQYKNIDVEIESREALIQSCQEDIDAVLKEIQEYTDKLEAIAAECKAAQQKFQEVQAQYNAAVEESREWNTEYNQIEEEIRELNQAICQIEMKKIQRDNLKKKLESKVDHCAGEIEHLKKEHKTMNFDKEELPHGEDRTLQEVKADFEKYKRRFDEVRERIDVDAAQQFLETKALMTSAEDRIHTIEENKKTLAETMVYLDEQKLNIVNNAYFKVNTEFNKMMGTLLPDSQAKLVPVNEHDLSQGLNIHVCLGGVWKESLSELSGGQKSLVALALVLSLCMYNPAPFYILDEIDSALDLNHTQNIGVLIKKMFMSTQFICVSLKDGMYSNCNILFQVQFSNGRSEVKRCVRQSSKKADDSSEHNILVPSKQSKRFNKIVSGR